MIKCNLRIGNIEFRTCDKNLLNRLPHATGQVVAWESDNHCYTIACWDYKEKEEGYDLHFICDRAFKLDEDIWDILAYGQKYLDNNIEGKEDYEYY